MATVGVMVATGVAVVVGVATVEVAVAVVATVGVMIRSLQWWWAEGCGDVVMWWQVSRDGCMQVREVGMMAVI